MRYLYGDFTDEQVQEAVRVMHNDIHKLLLYKDNQIDEVIFNLDKDFITYFNNLLFRFGGLNELLGEPDQMVALMSTLQAAYDEVLSNQFHYKTFRRAILDCHGYLKTMFEEVKCDAKSTNS